MFPESQPLRERMQELRVGGHRERGLAGRRLAASRQVGDQDPTVVAESGAPGMEVFERADEAMTQQQRVARSLVEVPDPPLPDIDELNALGGDRRCYSPVSIWARCSRPL